MTSAPAYDPQNIFARILRGEIPCFKIYEDERAFAFLDINAGHEHLGLVRCIHGAQIRNFAKRRAAKPEGVQIDLFHDRLPLAS